MLSEISIDGVLLAPIVLYALSGLAIFGACRFVLGRFGVLRAVWHPALFEMALYISIVALLVLYL
jgi:hypothetical protein